MKTYNSISIVIPVLNEEETIVQNIEKIRSFLDSTFKDIRVTLIIADNGSTDNTEVLAKQLIEKYSNRVKYEKVPKRGVGLALKYVWPMLEDDIIGYMDLDIATDLKHLLEVMDLFQNNDADIVYGTRLNKRSEVIGRTIKREITSRAFNFILKSYLGVKISDGMCGFKFLKKNILDDIMKHGAKNDGWFFCTELLVIGEWRHYKLCELPVKWTDDPNSKANIQKLTIEYLKGMYRLKNTRIHSVD